MKTSVSAYHFLRSRHPFITHTVLCLLLPFSVGTFLFHKLYRAYFLFFCRHFFCFTSFIVPTFSFSIGTFLFHKPNRACHPLLLFQNKKEREMKIPFSALLSYASLVNASTTFANPIPWDALTSMVSFGASKSGRLSISSSLSAKYRTSCEPS